MDCWLSCIDLVRCWGLHNNWSAFQYVPINYIACFRDVSKLFASKCRAFGGNQFISRRCSFLDYLELGLFVCKGSLSLRRGFRPPALLLDLVEGQELFFALHSKPLKLSLHHWDCGRAVHCWCGGIPCNQFLGLTRNWQVGIIRRRAGLQTSEIRILDTDRYAVGCLKQWELALQLLDLLDQLRFSQALLFLLAEGLVIDQLIHVSSLLLLLLQQGLIFRTLGECATKMMLLLLLHCGSQVLVLMALHRSEHLIILVTWVRLHLSIRRIADVICHVNW